MILNKVTAKQWTIGILVFIAVFIFLNLKSCKKDEPVKVFIPKIDTRAVDSLEKEYKKIVKQRDSIQYMYDLSLKKVLESNKKAAKYALAIAISKKIKDTPMLLESCDSLQEIVVKQEILINDHAAYVSDLKHRNDSIEQALLKEIDALKSSLGLSMQSNTFLSEQLTLNGKKINSLQRKLNNKFHISVSAGYGASYNNSSGIKLGPIGGITASYTIF